MSLVQTKFGWSLLATVACGSLLLSGVSAQADTAAASLTGYGTTGANAGSTQGWEFSTTVPLNVTALGFYDIGGNQVDNHPVGIWTTSGTLLDSATVATTDPLGANDFRYHAITPYTLAAGTYIIGAGYPDSNDSYVGYASGFATAPQITYITSAAYNGGGGFQFPSFLVPQVPPSIFGPNFEFTTATTPEPGTLALLASSGLGAFGLMARKRRRK